MLATDHSTVFGPRWKQVGKVMGVSEDREGTGEV